MFGLGDDRFRVLLALAGIWDVQGYGIMGYW
jgi:hypothetical protein